MAPLAPPGYAYDRAPLLDNISIEKATVLLIRKFCIFVVQNLKFIDIKISANLMALKKKTKCHNCQ